LNDEQETIKHPSAVSGCVSWTCTT